MEDFDDLEVMSVMSGTSMSMSTLSLDERDETFPRCTTHRKRMKFFCRKHKLLVCSVCAVKKHRQCDEVLTLQEAVDDKKCEGKKIVKIYSERISTIEGAITERRASKKLLGNNVKEVQAEVHTVIEKMVDLLRSEEKSIIHTLEDIQKRETDALDKDISSLERSCSAIKDSHGHLDTCLKGKDVDLIHAVMKEQQVLDDTTEKDVFVKKKFKDVNLKFTTSPQVQSFMKQFKQLGSVSMSDGETTSEIKVNNYVGHRYGSMNDLTRSATTGKRYGDSRTAVPATSSRDDSYIGMRTRWARERQQHQSKFGDKSFTSHSRLTSPPNINDVPLSNGTSKTGPIHSTADGQSNHNSDTESTQDSQIKEQENSNGKQSPQEAIPPKDVASFKSEFSFVKAEPVEIGPPRWSPINLRQKPEIGTGKEAIEITPKRVSPLKLPDSPTEIGVQQNNYQNNTKHEQFGRTFAAVKVREMPSGPLETSEVVKAVPRMGIQGAKPRTISPNINGTGPTPYTRPQDTSVYNSPKSKRRPNVMLGLPGQRKTFDDHPNLIVSSVDDPPMLQDDIKGRQWILKKAFAPQGYGSKKMVSGVGLVSDGGIVVVDQENYSVQLFDKDYKFVSDFKLDSRPFDITVLNDNKIVVSLQSERLLKFFLVTRDSLNPIADLGVPCELVCYGLCRGDGVFCVCCGNEVWVLSDQGRIVSKLRNDSAGHGLFARAEYAALDRTGTVVYVTDAGSQKVIAVEMQSAKRLWEMAREGFEPAGLKVVEHYLYVADRGQHRILMLNMDGQIVRQSVVGRIENPCALCFNNAANSLVITQMRLDTICAAAMPIHFYQLS